MRRRSAKAEARRNAIVSVALEEFASRGYAATRLDDIAQRAGVAKGTIYLYFRDKEALFQELVRSALVPVVAQIGRFAEQEVPIRRVAEAIVELFIREVLGTRRKDVIRLVLTEGPRFPDLAEFYYREVVSVGLDALRPVLKRAAEKGELAAASVAEFPQLLVAPALLAILWQALFGALSSLDARALMHAHLDALFGPEAAR